MKWGVRVNLEEILCGVGIHLDLSNWDAFGVCGMEGCFLHRNLMEALEERILVIAGFSDRQLSDGKIEGCASVGVAGSACKTDDLSFQTRLTKCSGGKGKTGEQGQEDWTVFHNIGWLKVMPTLFRFSASAFRGLSPFVCLFRVCIGELDSLKKCDTLSATFFEKKFQQIKNATFAHQKRPLLRVFPQKKSMIFP